MSKDSGHVKRATFERDDRRFRVQVQGREISLQEHDGKDWTSYCTGRMSRDGRVMWSGCEELAIGRAAEREVLKLLELLQPAAEPPPAASTGTPSPPPEEPAAAPVAAGAAPARGGAPAGQRCGKCKQPGHNARSCTGSAMGKKPRPAATTTIRGFGPPAPPPVVVTGTATTPGFVAGQDFRVEIRPGDTGEEIAERIAAARTAAPGATTIAQDEPEDEDPVDAAERCAEARQRSGPPESSDEVEKEETSVAENPAPEPEVSSLDPFQVAGRQIIDRLLEPTARPRELSADEEAAALAEINRAAAQARLAVSGLLDQIPEASAEDLAGARTEEAPAVAPMRPPLFRFMLPPAADERAAALVHGVCSGGAPPFCGADNADGDLLCLDVSVSLDHEDGRDLTCPACRAVWQAEHRAVQAEARVGELQQRLAERDRTIDGLNNRVQELGRERDDALAKLAQAEILHTGALRRADELEAEVEGLKADRLHLTTERRKLEGRLAEGAAALLASDGEIRHLREQLAARPTAPAPAAVLVFAARHALRQLKQVIHPDQGSVATAISLLTDALAITDRSPTT